MHYQRKKRHGDPLVVKQPKYVHLGCAVNGCEEKHYGKSFCKFHYIQNLRHGDPLIKTKTMNLYGHCTFEDCQNKHEAFGLCRKHYAKFYRTDTHNKRRARKLDNGVFKVTKKELNRLYKSQCLSCGSLDRISLDHVIPISRGGRHSIGNIQPLCLKCNQRKGKKLMIEWKKSMKESA